MGTNRKITKRRIFQLLNDSVCKYVDKDWPFILKGAKGAKLKVTAEFPGLVIRDVDKIHITQMSFCNQNLTKCADHVLFLFNQERESCALHLFEMKTGMGGLTLKKACKQLNGAMIRACAIAGILRIPEFAEVYLYCVYRLDKSSPVTRRTFPGRRAQKDTLEKPITLYSYPKITTTTRLIKLDDDKPYTQTRLGEPRHFPFSLKRMAGEYKKSAKRRKKRKSPL